MTVSLKHSKVTTKPDGTDNSLIQPSDWNAEHTLTQATNRLLGRTTAGVGATEEITVGTGLGLGSGTLTADVTSVAGRTGAVTLGVTDVSGAAPLASPALTGTPTAPTAAVGTNTTQLATTAYVQAEGYLKSATAASTYAPLASPALTGSPTAPTAATADNSTLIATTAFVKAQSYLTTTSAASTYAPLASPTLTGTPTAPTAAANTNTGQIATTAFVIAQASNATPLMDGTATVGTATLFAREDHVHPTDTTRAPLASPALTGTPTAPTAAVGTNTTQIATTAYVQAEGYLKATTAATTYAPLASPSLTGTPTAPTAAANTNTTQIATTAFVVGQGYLTSSTAASTYAPLASPTFTGTVTIPAGASISGYLTTSAAAAGYVPQTAATGAATLPSGTSAQRPGSPAAGQVRYNTNTGKFEGYSTTWGNLGGGAAIGDNPPANPGAGDLWWNSADGNLYVYYTDANTSQWVSVTLGGQGEYLPAAGGTLSGDLNFAGTGRRITGDFSNATLANRLAFQTTTVNGATAPLIIPNGTGSTAGIIGFNSSDPDNASFCSLLAIGSTDIRLSSGATGTGTNRPMTFYTAGSERARIDTSGNVGIGTSSPLTTLHTYSINAGTPTTSGTATTGVSARFQNQNVNFDIGTYASGACFIQPRFNGDNSSNFSLVLNPNGGNVGIGTNSPTNALQLVGTAKASSQLYVGSNADDNYSGGIQNLSNTSRSISIQADPNNAGASSILTFGVDGTERMRIDSSGNVAINKTSTSYKLGVKGGNGNQLELDNAGEQFTQIDFANNGTTRGRLWLDNTNSLMVLQGATSVGAAIHVNGSEAMRVDVNKNVLIATTSTSLTDPGVRLYDGGGYGRINFIKGSASGTGATAACVFYYNGTQVGSITNTSTATVFNTSSDYRLKEDVQPMQNGLATISALKPVTYTWKVDGSHGEGFIAHEIADHIPLAVTGEKDAVDDEGNIKPQSVDYSKVVVHLVAAIQELKAELDAAKAEIAALKGAQ